ncbi:MAG: ArsR family transcriptional regulator [Actinomycetia bacterium]|nr:ArsR family transcriptional regulator [Actinomycetes bacterium]
MPAREKRVVTLTDPTALRAIAHPARRRLVRELFAGRVLTATEAAEMVGLTPSAVSHHLRALEKWGLAERADDTGDARRRPWRGTGTTLNLDSGDDLDSQAAVQPFMNDIITTLSDDTAAFMESSATDPWRESYRAILRSDLHLTESETRALGRRLEELSDEFGFGRTEHDHPDDARRTSLTIMFIPTEPPP